MNTNIRSIFTFGILLVSIGLIGHYFDWSQAKIFLLLGLVFEMLAALLFIWQKIKKQ